MKLDIEGCYHFPLSRLQGPNIRLRTLFSSWAQGLAVTAVSGVEDPEVQNS